MRDLSERNVKYNLSVTSWMVKESVREIYGSEREWRKEQNQNQNSETETEQKQKQY